MHGKEKKPWVHYLAMYGCMATGLVYTAIGIIALLSQSRTKRAGADEGSLFVYLDTYFVGKTFAAVITLGMIGLVIWRIYEAIKDPYHYGIKASGLVKRGIIIVSCLTDALIAYYAVLALLHKSPIPKGGQATVQRQAVHHLLREHGGSWMVLGLGIFTFLTALVQFAYALHESYMERLDLRGLKGWRYKSIHVLAWAGHFARGFVLGLIGFFLMKAAVSGNLNYVLNTDRAFDYINSDVGRIYFILAAVGTVCYGIFMLVFGLNYNSGKF